MYAQDYATSHVGLAHRRGLAHRHGLAFWPRHRLAHRHGLLSIASQGLAPAQASVPPPARATGLVPTLRYVNTVAHTTTWWPTSCRNAVQATPMFSPLVHVAVQQTGRERGKNREVG
jgi:hypothetical protein